MSVNPIDLSRWLKMYSGGGAIWYIKRLSGNDTLANGTHQAGPYMPRGLVLDIFRGLNEREVKNPSVWFDFYVDSHSEFCRARAIWYNNALFGGTRNETRLTNFGGRGSVLLSPESTGALTLFSFQLNNLGAVTDCHGWVCRNEIEENIVEDWVGSVDPGEARIWLPEAQTLYNPSDTLRSRRKCWLGPSNMPASWQTNFPSPSEVIKKSVELCPLPPLTPDQRLMRRRACELELFLSIEQALELPRILKGFTSIEKFIGRAQTILQRRKSRSGRSLELHTCEIFKEEHLVENEHFSFQPTSEVGKRPDFLFPSEAAYQDGAFPTEALRMLAVKTTCRDRWRQILSEADRIPRKHLLTLQEGVSRSQLREMESAGVQLVVPSACLKFFPTDLQPKLQTLSSFIAEARKLRNF